MALPSFAVAAELDFAGINVDAVAVAGLVVGLTVADEVILVFADVEVVVAPGPIDEVFVAGALFVIVNGV